MVSTDPNARSEGVPPRDPAEPAVVAPIWADPAERPTPGGEPPRVPWGGALHKESGTPRHSSPDETVAVPQVEPVPVGVGAPWGLAEGQVLPVQDVGATKDFRRLPDPSAGALFGESGSGSGQDLVTCPECGTMAEVSPARREASDFCPSCDFPLFWARSTVILPSSAATGASLRRLPGTVGKASTAFIPCPHCGEPNSPAAQICVRCTLSMILVVPPPPPPPVYVPPPPLPPLEPEPERSQWIWWVIIAVLTLVILGFTLWALLR